MASMLPVAGPSKAVVRSLYPTITFKLRHQAFASSSRRWMDAAAATEAPTVESTDQPVPKALVYPFSDSVFLSSTSSSGTTSPASLKKPHKSASITSLTAFPPSHPNARLLPLFSRKPHPERIPLLSVVNVVSAESPARAVVAPSPGSAAPAATPAEPTTSSFTGVLTSVRHRGIDTSFVLRSIVNTTGIEIRYSLASPLLKDVQVLRRAGEVGGSGKVQIRKSKRAKVTYLRDEPGRMPNVKGAVKTMEREGRKR